MQVQSPRLVLRGLARMVACKVPIKDVTVKSISPRDLAQKDATVQWSSGQNHRPPNRDVSGSIRPAFSDVGLGITGALNVGYRHVQFLYIHTNKFFCLYPTCRAPVIPSPTSENAGQIELETSRLGRRWFRPLDH